MKNDILRVVDANLNRAREGLRVCEEIARFILADANLTRDFRALRHKIFQTISSFPKISDQLLQHRKIETDVGRKASLKSRRQNKREIFFANMQRVKESLRVLEEFSKLIDQTLSQKFSALRFRAYDLEKKVNGRF